MNRSPLQHSDAITREHRAMVYRFVSRRVPHDQVEDLVQDVLERAVLGLREMPLPPVNLDAWLTTVAHCRVVDHLRNKKKRGDREIELEHWADRLPPGPDPASKVIPRVGVEQFFAEARKLLSPRENDTLRLYLRMVRNEMSRPAMAEELNVEPRNFNQFLARWRARFRESLLVLAYLTEPGVDERCDFLADARQRERSATLRTDVAKHVARCPRCGAHRTALDKLIKNMAHAAPIVLPPGMFGRAWHAHRVVLRHKVLLATAGVAATACFVAVSVYPGQSHDDIAVARVSPVVVPAATPAITWQRVASPSPAVVVPARPVPSVRHHAVPTPVPSTAAAPPTPASPAGPEALTITVPANAIQHGWIAVAGCDRGSAPTTTAFTVTVTDPDGVAEVAAHLDGDHGRNEVLTRAAGTSTWTGTVGPYRSTSDGDDVRITVVAVGKHGTVAAAFVGTVGLISCRPHRDQNGR